MPVIANEKLEKLEKKKKDFFDSLSVNSKVVDNVGIYINGAVQFSRDKALLIRDALDKGSSAAKHVVDAFDYWQSGGKFALALTQYEVAVLSPYRRLFDAVFEFITQREISKMLDKAFLKRVAGELDLMKKEWNEFCSLNESICDDASVFFLKVENPEKMAELLEAFVAKHEKNIQRLGLIVAAQRERFRTLMDDAEALLLFFKETHL